MACNCGGNKLQFKGCSTSHHNGCCFTHSGHPNLEVVAKPESCNCRCKASSADKADDNKKCCKH
jgi:hypothetical protein